MEFQETFTMTEIKDLLDELGIDTAVRIVEMDDGRTIEAIDCEFGEMSFTCMPCGTGPFHLEVSLFASTWVTENPFEFANKLNEESYLGRCCVELDDDGTVTSSDDQFLLTNTISIPFLGTVTKEHVQFLINVWIEDLSDFFQLEEEDEEQEDDHENEDESDVANASTNPQPSGTEDTLLARLSTALTDAGNKTARQLSRELATPKNDINRTLYGAAVLFKNDGTQPPKWTLR